MNVKQNILVVVALLFVLSSCKRNYDESKFGPEVIIVPEDFTVNGFTISPSNSVNLATTDMYLNCSGFSQKAEFKIAIKGLLSGAEKSISGTGLFIDNTNSLWTGDSDNLNIFRKLEKCSVELSFRGAKQKYYDTITILVENKYPNTYLITDFEGMIFTKSSIGTQIFGTYIDAENFDYSEMYNDDVLPTPQGIQSAKFDGVDVDGGYYVGGFYYQPATAGVPFVFQGYEPDSLYLNVYIYSYGDNSAKLAFAINEDDNGNSISNAINEDDTWTKEVLVDWPKGWKLVSLRMKDFTDGNPTIGNGVFNLDRIFGFSSNVNAIVSKGRPKFNLDYVNVSYGKPFNP